MATRRQTAARPEKRRQAPDARIFDREHLARYTGNDDALERELLGLFTGQFEPVRTQLGAALSAEEWKFAAHTLKGSARAIGAPQIARLSEQLESMGYSARKKTKLRVLAQLDSAMAAFIGEAQKILS